MIFSIFCYIIAGIVLSFWGKQASIKDKRLTGNSVIYFNEFTILIIFTFFLFFGLRSDTTGVDTNSYVRSYETFALTKKFEREEVEPAFKWFTTIYATFNVPTWIFLGSFGTFMIGFVLLSIKNQYFLYPYVCAYIILGPIFLEWANVMRQSVAACIFLYSINYLEERKLLKYITIIIICFLIHKSALILIPFYWILKFKLYPKKQYIRLILLLVSFLIGQSSSWISEITVFSNLLSVIGLGSYTEHIDGFISEEREMAMGPSRVSLLIVTTIVIWTIPKIIYRLHLPKKYDIYFSLYFIGSCAYNIFANTSHLFLRPIQYFTITGVILVPLLLYYLIKQKYIFLSLIYGFLIYWYSTYVSIKAYMGGLGNLDPSVYSFRFLS